MQIKYVMVNQSTNYPVNDPLHIYCCPKSQLFIFSQRQEYPMLSGMLPPANPIISKNIDNLNERVNFRIDSSKQVIEFQEHRSRTLKSVDAVSPQVEEEKKRKKSEGSVEVGLAGQYRKEKRIFIHQLIIQSIFNINSKMKLRITFMSFIFLFAYSTCAFFTQKQIWLYWHSNFQAITIPVKLCYEKILLISQQQNWKVTLVTSDTLHKYINNYTEFQQTIKNRKITTIQSIGDYVKLLLIGDNGGVYFDISSIFYDGFDWLLKLENNPQLITNYVKGVEPEVLMFYTTITQYRTEYFYPGEGLKNYLPGYSLYFLAGKKGSNTIKIFKQAFVTLYTKTFEQGLSLMMKDNIFFRNLDHSYYLTIDRAIGYAVQKYQQALDNNISLFSKRKNANEQLKIWGLHCEDSTLQFPFKNGDQDNQHTLTMKQLRQQGYSIKYFNKHSGGASGYISILTDLSIFFNKHKTIQNYLLSTPSQQQCRTRKFITEGSIMGSLIQQSKQAKRLNIKIITVQQRNKWKNYCLQFGGELNNKGIMGMIMEEIVYSYKAYQAQTSVFERNVNKQITKLENFMLLVNQYRFMLYLYVLSCALFLLLLASILTIKRIIFYCVGMANIHYISQVQIKHRRQYIALLTMALYFPFPILLYFHIIVSGGVQQQQQILCVFLMFLSIKKMFFEGKSKEKILGLSLEEYENLIKSFSYYSLARTLIFSTGNREQLRLPQSLLLGLIFPEIVSLAQQLISENTQKDKSLLAKLVKYLESYSSIVVAGIICIFILVPNVRYMRIEGAYFARKHFYVVCVPMAIFYGLVFYEICRSVSQKWKSNTQKGIWFCQAQIIIKFLFINALILKCLWINKSYTHWISTQQKIFLDTFMMAIFIIINLSNCAIFKSTSIPSHHFHPQPDQGSLMQLSPLHNSYTAKQQNDQFTEQSIIQNKQNVVTCSILQKERKITVLLGNALLFYFVPSLLIFFRWTYKDNQYNYTDFIPLEGAIIAINLYAIFIWKQYLQINIIQH